jgi:hypothetical protein
MEAEVVKEEVEVPLSPLMDTSHTRTQVGGQRGKLTILS